MKNNLLRVLLTLTLGLLMLSAAALALGSHDCADADGDHFCDHCWENMTERCLDADGDHSCDVCWSPVRAACADTDGDTWCDVCDAHMEQFCVDADANHSCDVCWAALGTCLDENKDHLCDLCGGVFWVDDNADGVCDGCDAVLTHVTAEHIGVYYYGRKSAVLADVAVRVTVEPYADQYGAPAGTVSVRWSDGDGNSYSTAEAALTFGQTAAVVEYPGLPLDALENGGRVIFTPYDAGFTPAENGCVVEFDLPCLRVSSDAGFTVNGVAESKLYLVPGTQVVVRLQPGLTENWEWVFEKDSARPEVSVDDLVTTFVMPEEDVDLYARWRCAVCTDSNGDNWCDVCEHAMERCLSEPYADVDTDAWYHDAVDYALEHDLMQPVGETAFAPDAPATRADLLYALWRQEGMPVVNYLMMFTDVDQEAPYAEAVRWAAAMGIAQGYPDGCFRPEEGITRQEMAAFLYRYVQWQGDGFTGMWMFLLDATDREQVAEWAYEPLCWLTMKDILNGDGTGALHPQAAATRAELAQVLMNYMEQ